MRGILHTVFVLIVLGGMMISAALGPAAAQASALQAVAATPCCPDDCPPEPDCGPACAAVMQCRSAQLMIGVVPDFGKTASDVGILTFRIAGVVPDYSVARTGLRRPPKS